MTNEERIEAIESAMELIEEAQSLVDAAVYGTGEQAHYEAYGRYGFSQLRGDGNPCDSSLNSLIETFSEENKDD